MCIRDSSGCGAPSERVAGIQLRRRGNRVRRHTYRWSQWGETIDERGCETHARVGRADIVAIRETQRAGPHGGLPDLSILIGLYDHHSVLPIRLSDNREADDVVAQCPAGARRECPEIHWAVWRYAYRP